MVDVVEESLDIDGKERGNEALLSCCLDVMGEG